MLSLIILFKTVDRAGSVFNAMALRRTRKVRQNSEDQPDGQQHFEQNIKLNKRKELFIQQFEKEGVWLRFLMMYYYILTFLHL